MTFETFLILLAILSVITSLFTEGVKHILDLFKVNYASNIVVLFVSVIVGGVGTVLFYLFNDYAWTTLNIICIFLMVSANWLGSMLGYDKIMQAITQIMKNKDIKTAGNAIVAASKTAIEEKEESK